LEQSLQVRPLSCPPANPGLFARRNFLFGLVLIPELGYGMHKTMKRTSFAVAVSAGLILAVAAWGVPAKENLKEGAKEEGKTYKNIPERNVFGLKQPIPPAPPPPPPPPTANVKLTGVTTLLGQRRAILVITPPGKPAESKMIKEGDREGDLEVLSINELTGTVRIRNNNQEAELNFADNGIKPPTAVLPPPTNAMPGYPGQPMGGLPPGVVMPQGKPGFSMNTNGMPPGMPTPTRILRQ
jgi:hypothetical protein